MDHNIRNKKTTVDEIVMSIDGSEHWPEHHTEFVREFIISEFKKHGHDSKLTAIADGSVRFKTLIDHFNKQINDMPKNPDQIQIALEAIQYGIQIGATITDKQDIKAHIKNYLANLP